MLNADDTGVLVLTQGDLLGANLFAYCNNNPIMYKDPSGYFITPANVIGGLIGAIGGWFVGNAIANYFGLSGWARWACTATTSLLLGVVGWFSGPAVFAAIKVAIIWSICAGTLLISKVADWIRPILGLVDSNRLNHIFGNVGHKLSGYLNSFGGNQGRAFYAVQNALDKIKLANGVFNQVAVKVNGYTIYVNGIVENGVKKIGTFFIK